MASGASYSLWGSLLWVPVVVRLGARRFRLLLLCARGTWQKEHVFMVREIKAKLILQLRAEGLSGRAIAVSQSMSRRSIAAVVDAADRVLTPVFW